MLKIKNKNIQFSLACAINLGSSVIITGSINFPTNVTEYNEAGWVRDLPGLLQGRYSHGCSYYNDDVGTKVILRYVHIYLYYCALFISYTNSDNFGYGRKESKW